MKLIVFLLAAMSLAACTTPPTHQHVADPEKKWEQRLAQLPSVNRWSLNGRIALINENESWQLNMEWRRQDDNYILDLSGPFGTGHAQLTGSKESVVLVDADQNYYYANSPDSLLQEVTGLYLPVKSLLYWINGIPDGTIEVDEQKIDAYGRLSELKQSGWRIRFKQYLDVKPYELPQKIFIDGFNIKVKIFVDEWQLKIKTGQSS